MSVKLTEKYVSSFLTDSEINSYSEKIKTAHKMLHEKTGAGSDFTGWVDLPVDLNIFLHACSPRSSPGRQPTE